MRGKHRFGAVILFAAMAPVPTVFNPAAGGAAAQASARCAFPRFPCFELPCDGSQPETIKTSP